VAVLLRGAGDGCGHGHPVQQLLFLQHIYS
jgi:hypothetical protein